MLLVGGGGGEGTPDIKPKNITKLNCFYFFKGKECKIYYYIIIKKIVCFILFQNYGKDICISV
jgi:hypothetical protein